MASPTARESPLPPLTGTVNEPMSRDGLRAVSVAAARAARQESGK